MVKYMPNNIELKNLFIDIHCLGRNPQGEGILFIIRKDDYILFSMLIDEGYDKDLFEKENIEKFDFICWTHPHDDHSEGIKKIIEKHTKSTSKVVVPNGLYDVAKRMTSKCKKAYKPIKKLNRNGRKRNGEYIEANQYSLLLEDTYIDTKENKIEIEVRAISPISKRVNNLRNNKNINMNDLSVCLIIKVNNVGFLFTSDIYNNVINDINVDKKIFDNIIYCKIPHHGSDRSDNILEYLPSQIGNFIAVTTIYKKNGEDVTPSRALINKYLEKKYKVFCTSKSYIDDLKTDVNKGIISTRIKLNNDGKNIPLEWDIKFAGEATEINEKTDKKFIF